MRGTFRPWKAKRDFEGKGTVEMAVLQIQISDCRFQISD